MSGTQEHRKGQTGQGLKGAAAEIASLAGEHHEQLELLAALSEAVMSGEDRDTVVGILDRLTGYTDVHFMSEQLLMRLHSFPDYRVHESEHDELVRRMTALRTVFEASDQAETLKATNDLFTWLVRHINGSDNRLETFLAGTGPTDGGPLT